MASTQSVALFNTLSRKVEAIKTYEEGKVRMYSCGPTVYNIAHIGNLRTFLFQDLLKRVLSASGFSITHCMNITDVEDKIIRDSQVGLAPDVSNADRLLRMHEFTDQFSRIFFQDLEALKILPATVYPKATNHIPEMISMIDQLIQKDLAYPREGSVYFRVKDFKTYGQLSRISLGSNTSETEDHDEYDREHARDFVLWKAAKSAEPFWNSPWGPGRPGWHIECSAMGLKVLGEHIDLHSGGVDLIFPHHENEIAQSEGCLGHPWVTHWTHGEFLLVDNEKMSKSLGNFYSLKDLVDRGIDPIHFRFMIQSNHYRKLFNFSFEGLRASKAATERIRNFKRRMEEAVPLSIASWEGPLSPRDRIDRARNEFWTALRDDLNTPEALAALYTMISDLNALDDRVPFSSQERQEVLLFLNEANQIFEAWPNTSGESDQEIEVLVQERIQAKKNKDWKRADEIRDQIQSLGITLEDTRDGQSKWFRR